MIMEAAELRKRFYVGNLFEGASEIELSKLFSKYGKIAQTEIKTKKDIDGKITSTFAFVTVVVQNDDRTSEIIRECNNLKWKKHVIKVQVAQESFLQRLQKERQDASNKTKPDSDYDPIALMKNRVASIEQHIPKNIDAIKQQVPENIRATATVKRRVYDSSSDDDDEDELPAKKAKHIGSNVGEKSFAGSGFLSKLESSSFWNDETRKSGATGKPQAEDKSKGFWMNNDFARDLSGPKSGDNQVSFLNSKQPSSGGFSLLGRFGQSQNQAENDDGKSKNMFKYESSEDEEENAPKVAKAATALTEDAKFGLRLKEKAASQAAEVKGPKASSVEQFFYNCDDTRFSEGVKFLQREESMDKIRENFEEQRPILAGILKKKMRSRIKKQELQSFSGGKRKNRQKRLAMQRHKRKQRE